MLMELQSTKRNPKLKFCYGEKKLSNEEDESGDKLCCLEKDSSKAKDPIVEQVLTIDNQIIPMEMLRFLSFAWSLNSNNHFVVHNKGTYLERCLKIQNRNSS